MTEPVTKFPVKVETRATTTMPRMWSPLEDLRRDLDRLFEGVYGNFWTRPFPRMMLPTQPFWGGETMSFAATPAVNVAETDKAYEITAELPGLDEKHIQVQLTNGYLRFKGEKKEEKTEKEKDYYLQERCFGSFERSFLVPDSIDPDKIEARFHKGVLTVVLPKKAEARKPETTIEVKAA
jgi:HSP20 family protein